MKNTNMLVVCNELAIPVFPTHKEKYSCAVYPSLILLWSHALGFHECSSASR